MKKAIFLLLAGLGLTCAALADPAPVLIRVPAGTAMPEQLAALLSKWRQSGHVAKVLLLTQGKPETADHPAQFEAIAVLTFADDHAAEVWQKQDAPALPAGLTVRQADVLAANEIASRDSTHSVFVVNTYSPTVAPEQFGKFVTGYVKPLYEAMRATELLVGYTSYLERGAVGKADAINVLEYRDPAALKTMAKQKAGIRDQVAAAVPTYSHYDKIKDSLRIDGHGTLATWTALPSAEVSSP
jgi:hypothetical protein